MSSNSSYINEDGDVVIGKREKKRKLHGKPEPMDQQKRLVVVLEGACLETVKGKFPFYFKKLLIKYEKLLLLVYIKSGFFLILSKKILFFFNLVVLIVFLFI